MTASAEIASAALREQDDGQISNPTSVDLALEYLQELFTGLACRRITQNTLGDGLVPVLPAAMTHVLAV